MVVSIATDLDQIQNLALMEVHLFVHCRGVDVSHWLRCLFDSVLRHPRYRLSCGHKVVADAEIEAAALAALVLATVLVVPASGLAGTEDLAAQSSQQAGRKARAVMAVALVRLPLD